MNKKLVVIKEKRRFNYFILILSSLLLILVVKHIIDLKIEHETFRRILIELRDKQCD